MHLFNIKTYHEIRFVDIVCNKPSFIVTNSLNIFNIHLFFVFVNIFGFTLLLSKYLNNFINDKNLINYFNYSLELVKSIYTGNKTYNTSNYFSLVDSDDLNFADKMNLSLTNDIKLNMINEGYKQSVSQIHNIISKFNFFKYSFQDFKINLGWDQIDI